MTTSTQKINSWLRSNFIILDSSSTDLRFDCPECGYKNFYFNTSKRIGYCQKASCHYTPTLNTLRSLPGKSKLDLDFDDYIPPPPTIKPIEDKTISLDRDQYPNVLHFSNGSYTINNAEVFDYLQKRLLREETIVQYDMRYGFDSYGKERIYVPVYEGGRMVSYVGRLFKKGDVGLRYSYCSGTKINNFLLDYDYISNFSSSVCLVENTFVAAALGPDYTTNFGSHLSETQIDKLCRTDLKSVVLLWDGGADASAAKAVARLRARGMLSAYVSLLGKTQPDDLNQNYVFWLYEQAKANLQSPDGCAIRIIGNLIE